MDYEWSEGLWKPQEDDLNRLMKVSKPGTRIGHQAPTGTGKTRKAVELFLWAQSQGLGGIFFVNRKILIPQTLRQLEAVGLHTGVRAAEYEDMFDADAPFQVSSAPSEQARVYKSQKWQLHEMPPGSIVVVDEAHLQKSKVMQNLIFYYQNAGCRVILITATPVGMKKWMDECVVGAPLKEWRDVGALVPVYTLTISQPDMRKVKRNATGEYLLSDRKRKIYTQHIVGDVLAGFKENDRGNGAMVYAPCVKSSRFLVQEAAKVGISLIHVDATEAIIDGKEYSLTRTLWDDVIGMVKNREVHGLSSRFKCREGLDIPQADLCILATPVGSLASYIQICGRIMRSSPGKKDAVLQCHGGSYWTHGSCNVDQDWQSLWQLSEHAASTFHQDQIANNDQVKEPIRCPECGCERRSGNVCPKCGFKHEKSVRKIVQEDGELKEVTGDLVRPKRRKEMPDTADLWARMFYGFRNKKLEKSFAQLEAFFFRTHNYWPSRNLKFMPRHAIDWKAKVYEVPMSSLIGSAKEKLH